MCPAANRHDKKYINFLTTFNFCREIHVTIKAGGKALNFFHRTDCDMILLDVKPPEADGFRLGRMMRRKKIEHDASNPQYTETVREPDTGSGCKMDKYGKLVSNTMLLSVGSFGSKLLVFLMVRFYTGYLTPADYGTADLITQTATLLIPLVTLGITESVFRFAVTGSDKSRKRVFSAGFYIITGGCAVMVMFAPLLCHVKSIGSYTTLILCYTAASGYHTLCAQYVRALQKVKLYAVQGLINTMLVIVLNILFLAVFDMGIYGYVMSVIIADAAVTLILVFREKLWRHMVLRTGRALAKRMLFYSVPLIPTTIFWWIMSVSDRYMINWFIGAEANGIYAVAYKIPTILSIVSGIFMDAWNISAISESQSGMYEHGRFFTKVWGSFIAVMFIAASFITAAAPVLIMLLADEEYYTAWQYMPILALAIVFTAFSSFMGSVYVVKKKSVLSFATSVVGAAVNIVLNLLLIPSPMGIWGAAAATLVSCAAVFAIRAADVRKYILIDMQIRSILFSLLTAGCQAVLAVFMSEKAPLYWMLQAAAFALIIFINRKTLKQGIGKFTELYGEWKKKVKV